MKHHESRKPIGWAATVLFAGAVALVTGCVEHRVEYVPGVQQEAAYEAPPPPPPPGENVAAPMPVAPPAPVVLLRSSAELDRMLGPIALYPDPLIAQILPASTLPEQVVLADRYVRGGGDPAQIDQQPWDLSVKALARYPTVLQMMDDNLAWTTDLGQAFLNQPTDVMDAIQRLRAQARAVGNLRSTAQQTVLMDDGAIEIVPTNPEIIYVPVYQPEIVYVQPPPAPGSFRISFGIGFTIGAWLNHDCDWHDHNVIVWHHDHPRPRDWWYHPASRGPRPAVVNQVTVVNNPRPENQHFTVWHPGARPAVSGTDRADRGWGPPGARPAPAPKEVRPPSPPKGAHPLPAPKDNRPVTMAKDTHPTPAVTEPQPPPVVKEARPAPPAGEVRPAQPPSGTRPVPAPKDTRPVTVPKDTHPTPGPRPAQPPPVAKEARPPALPKEAHPAPAPQKSQAAPARAEAPPAAPPKEARPAPAPKPAPQTAPPPANTRTATPAARPEPPPPRPSNALAGIESARMTRESSSRGQQSRESMARPSPPPHSSAPAPPARSSAPAQSPSGRSGADSKKH